MTSGQKPEAPAALEATKPDQRNSKPSSTKSGS
jgi:hypothetical protein